MEFSPKAVSPKPNPASPVAASPLFSKMFTYFTHDEVTGESSYVLVPPANPLSLEMDVEMHHQYHQSHHQHQETASETTEATELSTPCKLPPLDTVAAVEIVSTPSKKCSVSETSVNLLTVLTGSGLLALPFAARSMGWSAVILLLLEGGMFMYSFVLIGEAISTVVIKKKQQQQPGQETQQEEQPLIDFSYLGKESFGANGELIVTGILFMELFLALVTFLINIALHLNVLFPSTVSVETGVWLAAIVTVILAQFDLKKISITSALGVILTLLVFVALVATAVHRYGISTDEAYLNNHIDNNLNHLHHGESADKVYSYTVFQARGVPFSLGIISFCFGGHGTL